MVTVLPLNESAATAGTVAAALNSPAAIAAHRRPRALIAVPIPLASEAGRSFRGPRQLTPFHYDALNVPPPSGPCGHSRRHRRSRRRVMNEQFKKLDNDAHQELYMEQVRFGQSEQVRRHETPVHVPREYYEKLLRELDGGFGPVYIVDPRLGFNNRTHRF